MIFMFILLDKSQVSEKRNTLKHCSLAGERVHTPVQCKYTRTKFKKNTVHSKTESNGLAVSQYLVHFAMHTLEE